jgi:adenylosuccinate lyase
MIERYEHPVVLKIWNEQSKFDRWTAVEKAACSVLYERGEITDEEYSSIRAANSPNEMRIKEIERTTDHDVVAFIRALSENIEVGSQYVHKGLTSSDVCDTAQAIAIVNTLKHLISGLGDFNNLRLKPLAHRHKNTLCIGRTHGIHAEITTFGIRVAGWYAEIERNIGRLKVLIESLSHGKLSGAVGTYSQNDPEFELEVLTRLGLKVEKISTQIVPRDRHAELINGLSLLGSAFERIALEIRSLQRTEIRELEEGFKDGQTGSSAMPHKRNPISSEKICGLARLLRGYMVTANENIALWHDRDISHSSVERIIIPDSFHLVFHMLEILSNKIFPSLVVFSENMMNNISKTGGLVFSQNVLLYLLSKCEMRDEAYRIVQQATKLVWDGEFKSFKQAILSVKQLPEGDIDKCFNMDIKYIDDIFRRVF